MINTQIFELINGEFLPEEGREILQNIFSSKIQFHQMKNFSSHERFGKNDETAIKRIPKLNNNLNEILKIIKEAEKNGECVEIKSEVVIRIFKK